MFVLTWFNFEDRDLNVMLVSEDRETLQRAAFDLELELMAQDSEPGDEVTDWDPSDWTEVTGEEPRGKTHWVWGPEWFGEGFGYRVDEVVIAA